MSTSSKIQANFSDQPITTKEQDLFGMEPFASNLALCIQKLNSAEGMVIALNGKWGSGKTSAINLVKMHLKARDDSTTVVAFNPWWFGSGESQLALAFFSMLQKAIKPTLTEKLKDAIPKMGARLIRGVGKVAPAADAIGGGGIGTVAGAVSQYVSEFIDVDESVEDLREKLASGLRSQSRRFVVVIDDIDRLGPDEALAVFRLIKSVGLLPQVTYLLAFDREMAEKMVSEKFPSEGPNYLEKIVQTSFDLPLPSEARLMKYVGSKLGEIIDQLEGVEANYAVDQFHRIVSPEIRTMRDATRYLNAVICTWQLVAGEVNVGDYISLEAYRIFQPKLYRSIRDNSKLLCGGPERSDSYNRTTPEQLDVALLHSVEDKKPYREGLMKLFPRLRSIWSNNYSDVSDAARKRRVCVEQLFPIYFRLSLPDTVVAMSEIKEVVAHANDSTWISRYFGDAAKQEFSTGGTRVQLLLDAITTHGKDIEICDVEGLLRGIFSIADEINLEKDKSFPFVDNQLRIHWILRALVRGRTTLEERSAIVLAAAKDAPVGWLVNLAFSAWDDYYPSPGQEKLREDECITTEVDAKMLMEQALAAVTRAATNGQLIAQKNLPELMYRWRDLAKDNGYAVKTWFAKNSSDDDFIVRIAAGFLGNAWSQGTDDLVAQRRDNVHPEGFDTIFDSDHFRSRLDQLDKSLPAEDADLGVVRRFLKAWDVANAALARRAQSVA